MKPQSGFTLLEMAIVVMIIALLMGAIYTAKSMVAAARVVKTISQIQKYAAAAKEFETKYDCMPGDCANAVSFNLGTSGGAGDNGNGNGYIDHSPYHGAEQTNFWYHLTQAGLVNDAVQTGPNWTCGNGGEGSNIPSGVPCWYGSIPNNGKVAVGSFAYADATPADTIYGANFFFVGQIGVWDTEAIDAGTMPLFSPVEAFAIDSKTDDGNPYTGAVLAKTRVACCGSSIDGYSVSFLYTDGRSYPSAGTAGSANCVVGTYGDTSSGTYNTTYSGGNVCSLAILEDF